MEKKVTIRKAEKSDAEMIWQCNCEGLGYTFALEDTIRRVHAVSYTHLVRIRRISSPAATLFCFIFQAILSIGT